MIPASTKSKIVVKLKKDPNPAGKRIKNYRPQKIEYELDDYDKVRMQLIFEDQNLYKAYLGTIKDLETNIKLQPKKRTCPCFHRFLMVFVQCLLVLILTYVFFLLFQFTLFNIVILGIELILIKRFYFFLNSIKSKLSFNYRTKEFNNYIASQNDTVYAQYEIKMEVEKEGTWLEFILKKEGSTFDLVIADRRDKMFNEKDTQAI